MERIRPVAAAQLKRLVYPAGFVRIFIASLQSTNNKLTRVAVTLQFGCSPVSTVLYSQSAKCQLLHPPSLTNLLDPVI